MKGIVFTFKRHTKRGKGIKLNISEFRYFFKRYGLRVLLTAVLLLGLVLGTLYARNIDNKTLNSLDFLFTTNLDARMSQDVAGTFCACLASNFIFIILIFLFALAPWGVAVIPLTLLFKGFGTGVTAGYLFLSQQFVGVGFYLLILLPGTFLFCLALVLLSSTALKFSKLMFRVVFDKSNAEYSVLSVFKRFCSDFLSVLILTFCASLLDTLLWMLFAGGFGF